MARTLTEIYSVSKHYRDQYLELTEFENTSKMSILDAMTWVTSACIWTFENIMDVFKVDVVRDLQNRVNGTPAYYANALLKFQMGDELVMNEEGTQFSYATVDETKRIISKVAYHETEVPGFHDKNLVLKVASGTAGAYEQLSEAELLAARAYIQQIAFAGVHTTVVSRKGDILVPRVTVFYDGAVEAEEMYSAIQESLNTFIASIDFDGAVYVQKIVDAIQRTEHVTDVYIDNTDSDHQGIFVAMFDDDNNLVEVEEGSGQYLQRVSRYFYPNSGYLRQSTGGTDKDDPESVIPVWAEAITLKIEGQN